MTTCCRKCKQPAQPQQTVTKSYPGTTEKSTDIFCAECNPGKLPKGYVIGKAVTTDNLNQAGILSNTIR